MIRQPMHEQTVSNVWSSISESAGGGLLTFLRLVLVEPDSEG